MPKKKLKKHWKKHKKKVITVSQIITIFSIFAGIYVTYCQLQQNKLVIERNNQKIEYNAKWIEQDLSNHTVIDTKLQKQVNTLSNKVENTIY